MNLTIIQYWLPLAATRKCIKDYVRIYIFLGKDTQVIYLISITFVVLYNLTNIKVVRYYGCKCKWCYSIIKQFGCPTVYGHHCENGISHLYVVEFGLIPLSLSRLLMLFGGRLINYYVSNVSFWLQYGYGFTCWRIMYTGRKWLQQKGNDSLQYLYFYRFVFLL